MSSQWEINEMWMRKTTTIMKWEWEKDFLKWENNKQEWGKSYTKWEIGIDIYSLSVICM